MNRSLRVALTFLVLATALPIASALAQPDAANARAFRCSASQLGAAGRLAHDVITCAAKAVRRAGAVEAACFAASLAKHSARTAAAQAEGGCITNPGTHDLADTGPLVAEVSAALAVDAPEAARSCAARKLRAAASEARALLGCYARSTRAGETVDAACVAKARADYARVFAKAEARSGCGTDGDAAAVEASIVDYAGRAVAALAAICGDGFVGPGEQCDGAADENCPGECLPFCACPGDCGNGVVEEPGEECDDGNVTSGDGCSSACQLENAKAVCAGVASVSGTKLGVELVESGLDQPTNLAAAPLDPRRIFIVEQPGRVRVIRAGKLLDTPFLDIVDRVGSGGERGLLGLAFDPNYERNGRFFVDYTDKQGDTVVSRFERITADRADAASEKILLHIDQPFPNHNGGQIAFDAAGYLYVGMGDGGSAGDPDERAQNDGEVLGKLLRLRVNVDVPPYWAVPAGNPHRDAPGMLALVWAKGLRNPWRFTFDRATDALYVADVGQGSIEEVNYTPAPRRGGENYGWDVFEGSSCFEPRPPADECPAPPNGMIFPVEEYSHAKGCSVTGGYVYRGCALPGVRGTYFYSDYCTGFIRTFEVAHGAATSQTDRTAELEDAGFVVGNTSSFGQDTRGELYILDHSGSVWKIVPRP